MAKSVAAGSHKKKPAEIAFSRLANGGEGLFVRSLYSLDVAVLIHSQLADLEAPEP